LSEIRKTLEEAATLGSASPPSAEGHAQEVAVDDCGVSGVNGADTVAVDGLDGEGGQALSVVD